ncbi:unnamed protein product [Anisakis simplex]|uniref:Sulfate_transp domain-containing protein n=1 Tax=Anisakis simplex TaxID=6269 RepID=A0A0M3JI33_ANISI|nr:unnamed protein product [Anisakis simplex]
MEIKCYQCMSSIGSVGLPKSCNVDNFCTGLWCTKGPDANWAQPLPPPLRGAIFRNTISVNAIHYGNLNSTTLQVGWAASVPFAISLSAVPIIEIALKIGAAPPNSKLWLMARYQLGYFLVLKKPESFGSNTG